MHDQKIVVATGSFDGNIHSGHISFLKQACFFGDLLYIFVMSDYDIKRTKFRVPLFSQKERIINLLNTNLVDKAIPFTDEVDKNVKMILSLKPHTYCFGEDHVGSWATELEKKLLKNGINVVRAVRDIPNMSTTLQIEEIRVKNSPIITSILLDLEGSEDNPLLIGLFKKLEERYKIHLVDNGSYYSLKECNFDDLKTLLVTNKATSKVISAFSNCDRVVFKDYEDLIDLLDQRNLLY